MTHAESLNVTAHGDLEILISRTFSSPPAEVFDAMTDPSLLAVWLVGPPGWSTSACTNDLRVGGSFRHEWRGPNGAQMAMKGVYREIRAPERLVRTETFEFGCESQGDEQLATLTLEPLDDGSGTALRIVLRFPSREARDDALASGMDQGLAAAYALLDRTLDHGAGR